MPTKSSGLQMPEMLICIPGIFLLNDPSVMGGNLPYARLAVLFKHKRIPTIWSVEVYLCIRFIQRQNEFAFCAPGTVQTAKGRIEGQVMGFHSATAVSEPPNISHGSRNCHMKGNRCPIFRNRMVDQHHICSFMKARYKNIQQAKRHQYNDDRDRYLFRFHPFLLPNRQQVI